MQYALDKDNNLVEPYKKGRATCKCCNNEVIAKCGDINVHHWSHKNKNDCEFEPMTQWHFDWQNHFNEHNREVVIKDSNGKRKIADIKNDKDLIIEFQHSNILTSEADDREEFYGKKMIWVFDVRSCRDNFELISCDNQILIRWKWERKHIVSRNRPTFLDFGNNIIYLLKEYQLIPFSKKRFVDKYSLGIDKKENFYGYMEDWIERLKISSIDYQKFKRIAKLNHPIDLIRQKEHLDSNTKSIVKEIKQRVLFHTQYPYDYFGTYDSMMEHKRKTYDLYKKQFDNIKAIYNLKEQKRFCKELSYLSKENYVKRDYKFYTRLNYEQFSKALKLFNETFDEKLLELNKNIDYTYHPIYSKDLFKLINYLKGEENNVYSISSMIQGIGFTTEIYNRVL